MRRQFGGPCELSHRCHAEGERRIGTKLMTKTNLKSSEPIEGRINCHFWKDIATRLAGTTSNEIFDIGRRSVFARFTGDETMRADPCLQAKLFDPSVLITDLHARSDGRRGHLPCGFR